MSLSYTGNERRFSRRFWVVFGCFLASLLFLLFQGGKFAFMTFIIVCILCAYILLGRFSGVSKVRGRRILSGVGSGSGEHTIEAGSTLGVTLDLHVPGIWPVPYILVRDTLVHRHKGQTAFETTLIPDWKRNGRVDYRTHPLRRGFYRFAETECSTGDVFGVFEHRGKLPLPHTFRVLPRTVDIPEWKQIHSMLKGMHHQTTATRAARETTQINGVREYNYGDRLSRIHWNATARTGTWKSKEFERESLPKTIIVLDRNKRHYAGDDTFELAVSTAASLFQFGRRQGLAIGLLSVGSDSVYLEPKTAASHYSSVLNHLVEAEADGHHTLVRVLEDRSRSFVPGTFVVLVTPLKGEDAWDALNWANFKQMNGCLVYVGANPAEDYTPWTGFLQSRGFLGYPVPALSELPAVLGGRQH